MEVRSPFDGSLIATLAVAGEAEIERALSTAHALFRDRTAWLPPARRIEILRKAARLMEERAESLAQEAARERASRCWTRASKLRGPSTEFSYASTRCVPRAATWLPMDINGASARRVAFTHREPIGVVVAVSTFNYPLNLIVHQVGPAIAAGCPSIVKPDGGTPLSCLRFVEILREAGLPQDWCQALVIDDTTLATRLVADRRVGFLSFIGSARVGWMLRSKLAPGARCALEHGGGAPVLVAEDADLDAALPRLVKGGFYYAGQVCVSVQRVYAHRSICDNLARRLADAARKLKVGDPLSAETEGAP